MPFNPKNKYLYSGKSRNAVFISPLRRKMELSVAGLPPLISFSPTTTRILFSHPQPHLSDLDQMDSKLHRRAILSLFLFISYPSTLYHSTLNIFGWKKTKKCKQQILQTQDKTHMLVAESFRKKAFQLLAM